MATAGQYERCLRAFRAGEWTEAETSLDSLIQSTPTFLPAHLLLGGVYAHRGRYEEAREQGWSDEQILEAVAHVALVEFAALVSLAGEIPLEGTSRELKPLRKAA